MTISRETLKPCCIDVPLFERKGLVLPEWVKTKMAEWPDETWCDIEKRAQNVGATLHEFALQNFERRHKDQFKPEETKPVETKPCPTNNKIALDRNAPKLWHTSISFTDCSMPTSAKKVTHYERKNGKSMLSLTATNPKQYSIPSGKDRFFFYWARTIATVTKSQILDFEGIRPTLEEMDLPVNGENGKWLKQVILKGHHTLIYFRSGDLTKGGVSKGELIIPTLEGLNLEDMKKTNQKGKIHLSSHFYDPAAIPIDLHIIQKLGRNYLAMDLYTFIRKRLYPYDRPGANVFIPIEDLREQFGFDADVSLKNVRFYLTRAIAGLEKAGFQAIPDFDKKNNLVIPNVKLPNILTVEAHLALSEIDKKSKKA